ncbi:Small ubiquitin- modifier 1 [Cadophora gregata]|uniref:Small ubiquitin- modifier 1 n=1 Tax=Cadophora gregata TaxID=51156 RepID=UPI0026DBD356|nr:Small ubiquitin- modifier 1 [Cadophora gregata]KAK0111208.1 Small ubiquitin- modifier 1 [Cadophora gregata]KAK0112319.1 Small ubiquitin- modifier 1 [Cadophora gregata f. sp. sojae]
MSDKATTEDLAGNGGPALEAKPEQMIAALEVKIRDQQENDTLFKIKKHTKFGKVFDAYCDRQSLGRNTVRFLIEGTRVQDNEIPEDLDLENGDVIQAMLEQVGGAQDEAGATESKPHQKPEGGDHIDIKVMDQ